MQHHHRCCRSSARTPPIASTSHDGASGRKNGSVRSTHARWINARFETAAEKPMFASSFSSRHCLVLADGYYEWRRVGKYKQLYRITLKTGEPFAMAGIYAREPTESETPEMNPVNFAILTTKANEVVSRMASCATP